MDTDQVLALTNGAFRSCAEVAAFIQETVRPPIESVPESDRKGILLGQLLRVQAWLGTLGKLNHPADFQAALCAERSLFEVTIDAVLLGSNALPEARMLAWEQSAKLKHVDAVIRYHEQRARQPVPEEPRRGYDVFLRSRASIERRRTELGWRGHPDRWTNRNLLDDARAADQIESGFRFEEWYETRYREVCWNVHSSAFVMRSLDMEHFPGMMMLAFNTAAQLALIAARWILRGLGLWTNAIAVGFDDAEKGRMLAFASAVPGMVERALRAAAAAGVSASDTPK